ncbi:peroxide/acid stress response protein YhcN [Shimwellia pseudoproteus]|uniref:peroxide/acid stress response protein YhcN n=1 Tax=Shimwellia pseudoproteus TaxID=570012 RepID=UPI0018EC76C3|nr:peroxide/acid stress response protein YhcN [Shimwellia pseudoproteus]MBJ3814891.1 peroxide/acid stress response protein YhcN [Shimwellia pseudoproteus]
MNIKNAIATISVLSIVSFGALAADAINGNQAVNREAIGTITVSQIGGTPMDMNAALSQKADQNGASAYRIIEARTGNTWHATAQLYK